MGFLATCSTVIYFSYLFWDVFFSSSLEKYNLSAMYILVLWPSHNLFVNCFCIENASNLVYRKEIMWIPSYLTVVWVLTAFQYKCMQNCEGHMGAFRKYIPDTDYYHTWVLHVSKLFHKFYGVSSWSMECYILSMQ